MWIKFPEIFSFLTRRKLYFYGRKFKKIPRKTAKIPVFRRKKRLPGPIKGWNFVDMFFIYLSNFPEIFSFLAASKVSFFDEISPKIPINLWFLGWFSVTFLSILPKNVSFWPGRRLKFSGKLDKYKSNIFPKFQPFIGSERHFFRQKTGIWALFRGIFWILGP